MKRQFLTVCLVALFVISLASQGEAAPIRIKLAQTMPVSHWFTDACNMLKDKIEKYSNGEMKVTHYPAGQLLGKTGMLEGIPAGTADLALHDIYPAKVVPSLGLTDLPHVYRGLGELIKVRTALTPAFQDEWAKHLNARILGWLSYGGSSYLTVKPVNKLSDFQGMKIRAYSEPTEIAVKSLGAGCVFLDSADVFLALQRGMIDGTTSGFSSYYTRKWYEVAHYCMDRDVGPLTYTFVANLNFWNKLSPENQKLISLAVAEVEAYGNRTAADMDADYIKKMKEKGLKFVPVPDEEMVKMEKVTGAALAPYFVERLGQERFNRLTSIMAETLGRPPFPKK